MLRFKNKFKFGSSTPVTPNGSDKEGVSPEVSLHSDGSPRNSVDSRRTISVNNLADNVSKLSVNGTSDSSNSTRKQDPPHDDLHLAPASINTQPSSTSLSTQSTSAAASSNPGLLTVKIYNSNNIALPIKINNNKQILHALAVNSNNEAISQQLLKNLNALENSPATSDTSPRLNGNSSTGSHEYLQGAIATNFLPSIITIPNAENLVKSLLYLTIEFDNNVLVIEPQKGTVNQSTWNQVVSFDVTKKSSNSNFNNGPTSPNSHSHSNGTSSTGSNFLNLNLFIRLPNMLIPDSEKTSKKHLFTNTSSSDSPANIGDLLIGTIKLPLNLKYHTKSIRLMNHEYLKFTKFNTELNEAIAKEMGEIMLTIEFKPITKKHLSIEEFDLLKVIGKGSFGKVMQVVKKDTKQIYALKTIRKQHIVSRMEVTHTLAERTVLARINNPFIVPLKFSFQSPEKLYLVLSFINGGELFWHLQREGKFSMDRSRFYIAELLTALESLHELNVIYRDLKPENILLDYQGHIALCDFGLCKLNMSNDDKTNTFCGTPEYLAPELLLNQGYTRSVDWWTLGTLLYEMLTGLPPFYDDDVPTMYRKILQNPLRFPSFLEGTDAQDLLVKLLQKDPNLRMNDAHEIKNHPFFKDIDWNKLLNKSYLPPFKPNVENLLDTSNFDQDFTNEQPQDSVVDDFLTESVQKQFGGWTYNGEGVF
ncbi:Serine/threonine-protein kinase [Scheffersomyces stipitis CBS 6054]|uniref:non-specific serine/threonine protein kinase n=1 Tax=Scheffersomyces stipitis (strain ATCC 58785 / CBS 6054 / NBRC 10063 / NRRL Y-11545) TaxID=322104 RepID=A3LQD3_PICST|nr:Serine/threonine-protein kinase [Scheffersomyces stipitis CBS 6054]ABN64661.2 Serine/threonine-protein kinase [Scheffersomyces stipitis CBS 6054]